jgi:hypothetical protein
MTEVVDEILYEDVDHMWQHSCKGHRKVYDGGPYREERKP